jgi:predicted N-acyltransferase
VDITTNAAIGDIAADAWNALVNDQNPLLRHEFLLAAERSGSVAPGTGWTPRHLTLFDGDRLRAAMPLYEKTHSWGEFVFDWSWAQAYAQAGLAYYPKLVAAVPFTPAAGPRLLLADQGDERAAGALVDAAIGIARDQGHSSFHVLFPCAADAARLESAGMKLRKDCQFHWHNRGYGDFDDFLATFSSAKRKKVRQDRRRVADAGITFRRLYGRDIDERTWLDIYRLISRTFMQRGALPYFDFDFFTEIGTTLPDHTLAILADLGDVTIAAAVFFESGHTLYGRYWGSDGHYDALHFETCYYQGIEHCIDTGKRLFEPGTQGEHKVARGFVPVETWSAHWLDHPEFFRAIGRYLDQEVRHVERYMDAVDRHSPYRDDGRGRPP